MSASKTFLAQYAKLNPEQKQAVDTIEGPVMVLAGPGTGKTQTLAMRIANILRETQMDPWNILCLTFTEAGVVAMRERLISIIGPTAYSVRIYTFHSFCNEVIQDHPELFAQAKQWQALTDIERVDLFRTLLDDMPIHSSLKTVFDPYQSLKDIESNIKKLKQEGIAPQDFSQILDAMEAYIAAIQKPVEQFIAKRYADRTDADCDAIYETAHTVVHTLSKGMQQTLEDAYAAYQEHAAQAENKRQQQSARTKFKDALKKWYEPMKHNQEKLRDFLQIYKQYNHELVNIGRYDYEDMVLSVVEAFQSNTDLLADYREQFQYILVDEYQDTNGSQNDIVRLLCGDDDSPNVFVVGDDKQSIYRFQGASISNMIEFYHRYKKSVKVVDLKNNYRSTAPILSAAGHLIAHNHERLSTYIPGMTDDLIPTLQSNAPVRVIEYASEDMEADGVARHIQELIADGATPSEIAVLVRYNKDGAPLYRALSARGVPTRLEVGQDVLKSDITRAIVQLVTAVANQDRSDALADVLLMPWSGVDTLSALKVIRASSRMKGSLFDAISNEGVLQEAGVQDVQSFIMLARRIADAKAIGIRKTVQEAIIDMIHEFGVIDYITGNHGALDALQYVTALLDHMKEINSTNPDMSLMDMLHNLDVVREHNITLEVHPWHAADDSVRVMTAHSSKGLEFDHVVIARANQAWGSKSHRDSVPLPAGLVTFDASLLASNNEEERRLFYVAMTRAKQSLTCTYSNHKAGGKPTNASQFVTELPQDDVVRDVVQEEEAQTTRRLATDLAPLIGVSDDGIRAWVKELVGNEVLSATHINNYLECPRKFYYRNVLRLPEVKSPSLVLGTIVHDALDAMNRVIAREHTIPSLALLTKTAQDIADKQLLTQAQRKDVLDHAQRVLEEYYKHYKNDFSLQVLGEYDFRKHGVVVAGVPITGKLDKIEILDEKTKHINVVDYKTGKYANGKKKLNKDGDYFRQLVMYKLLCDNAPDFPYTMERGEIDFVEQDDKKGFVKETVSPTEADTQALTNILKETYEKIQNLEFMNQQSGCGKEDCEYCN